MNLRTGWIISIVLSSFILVYYIDAKNFRFLGNNKDYMPAQPINFSHKVHSNENKIPCLYCHYGAESERHAGVPSLNVCMNCHREIKKDSKEIQKLAAHFKDNKPVEWVKVNDLPDFAYFNHSIHINRNIACEKCHGDVKNMDVLYRDNELGMGWCISCHREYTHEVLKLDPNNQVLVDCSVCHY